MFTIKPAKKNGWKLPGFNGNDNGHKNGNGAGGNGNGENGNGHKNGNGNGHKNGNGNGHGQIIETVIGPGVFFKGALTGAAGVRIEGAFEGVIRLKGPLVVADGARVTASEPIEASLVMVAGNVKGNIRAGKVEIQSTGRVWGDLTTAAFATEEGAFLRGQITMQDQIAPPETPPPPEVIEPPVEVAAAK